MAVGVINILLTSELGETLDDFVHDAFHLKFDRVGPEGPRSLIEGPVWAFVDWVMEDLAGLEMCRRLRADPRTADAHITMVLEEDDPEDRRRALRAGADDYMVGPIDRKMMLDRVLALKAHDADGETTALAARRMVPLIELAQLTIDTLGHQARWAGEPIELSPNEFRLLRYFAENPDRVLSRQELIAGLGKREPPIDERTVDVWVGRLRRGLKAAGAGNPLRTVHALGYVFDTY